MLVSLTVLALLLVAVTMGLALAHALEFPGKLRLEEQTYKSVQAIYYPGFTVGGLIGEFGSLVLLPVLLWIIPYGTGRYWWTAAALAFLILCHGVYWVLTHPTNGAWLKDNNLAGSAKTFFGLFATQDSDWRHLRNIWELSHVARAFLAMGSFLSLTIGLLR